MFQRQARSFADPMSFVRGGFTRLSATRSVDQRFDDRLDALAAELDARLPRGGGIRPSE